MIFFNITKKSIIAVSLACAALAQPINVFPKKVTTKLKPPAATKTNKKKESKTYTYLEEPDNRVSRKITFMGYDKKTGSTKETFFLDNGSDIPLKAIEIEISYFSTSGKLIHKRKVELNQEFPALETRKVDITSWDTQRSYHYINSVPPGKGSTPYTVKFKIISYQK